MFSRTAITQSTNEFSEQIKRLGGELKRADAVVIGAGAGLSAAAGFTYNGERFRKYFSDFGEKYGFADMYSGGFYPYRTAEEFWAYWSRYIYCNRYCNPPEPIYEKLLSLVSGKDYFVITTNVDHCFQKAGFDRERLFYTQGDYGLLQCSKPCSKETFDNEDIVREMLKRQRSMKIPTELIPKCPRCGRPLILNLRSDDKFVEDAGWQSAKVRYESFIRERKKSKTLFLELGVGYNTPVIIKYPFWEMTAENPNAVYACVNSEETAFPEEIKERSIGVRGDIGAALAAL